MDSSWWRTAVWYARRKHISQCQLQTEDNRARAQELLDRNAESNRRAEQKRKDREKEGREKELRRIAIVMKQGGDITTSPLYHYMDYIAPEVLERWVGDICHYPYYTLLRTC